MPVQLGCAPERAEIHDGKVHLWVRTEDGGRREIVTEHVITATGYKVDLARLTFLSEDIRSSIKALKNTPVLGTDFQSSVSGLYFVGIAAAHTFGPLMRFAFGADFAARHITKRLRKAVSRNPASVPVANVVATTK